MVDLTECKKGNHSLKTILISGYEDEPCEVVRWCKVCGSVVIDVDYDNKTMPGRCLKMQSPLISKGKV